MSFQEKMTSLMARPGQDPVSKDEIPWWLKFAGRGVGTVGGFIAIFLGIWNCVGILLGNVDALVAGMWQVVAGFILLCVEAPCCCMFIDHVQRFADVMDNRPFWNRALGYIIISLPPIIINIGICTIFGSGLIFSTGIIYGMMALGRKERAERSVKFLGVCLEDGLTWRQHINQLTSKLASTLFLLRRIGQMAPFEVSRAAYMGLFQSRISYGLLFWGNSTEWLRVFKMQKRALRIMGNKRPTDSCRPLFKEYRILTLTGLYIYQCLNFIKSREAQFVTVNSRHDYDTRHGGNLLLPQHRLTLTQKSYVRIAIKLFNSLPGYIKSMTSKRFKCKIRSLILEICPYTMDEFFAGVCVHI